MDINIDDSNHLLYNFEKENLKDLSTTFFFTWNIIISILLTIQITITMTIYVKVLKKKEMRNYYNIIMIIAGSISILIRIFSMIHAISIDGDLAA